MRRTDPKDLPGIGAFALALTVLCGCAPSADLVLRGGTVHDGTGSPGVVADVAIEDGRIVAIESATHFRGDREIDVGGLAVAPGFIDIHSHADLILLADADRQLELLSAKLRQGVTTIVVGNCGLGNAPSDAESSAILAGINGWMSPSGTEIGAMSTADYLDRLERAELALNVATLVPHGALRISAMGLEPGRPTRLQLDRMTEELRASLDAGAFGMSAGLIYPPGMFSDTDELVALSHELAAAGRLLTLHIRGSSETLIPATEELVEIARVTGARTHHSHLEAVGERFWPRVAEVLAIEDRARESGLRVTHDVFPYTRAATMMSAIFPPWSLEGGVPRLLDRLRDPETRERIRSEIEDTVPSWPPWRTGGWPHNLVGAVGWDGILVASVASNDAAHFVGWSLADIAAERRGDPFDAVVELMLDQEGRVGQFVDEISGRDRDVDTLVAILSHPASAVVSDAEDYGRGTPHPAHAGSFARALRMNREHRLMTLSELVRKMTSYPAEIVGLGNRGMLRVGSPADLVMFDPIEVTDRATWSEPRATPAGIPWVVLDGRIVLEDGEPTGALAGTVLRSDRVRTSSR